MHSRIDHEAKVGTILIRPHPGTINAYSRCKMDQRLAHRKVLGNVDHGFAAHWIQLGLFGLIQAHL